MNRVRTLMIAAFVLAASIGPTLASASAGF
jgi:hypothetical protein